MRVFRCYGTRSRAASSRGTVTCKSGLPELALLLSARSPVSPATFLTAQKMARNAKCAFFVAMALGRARQAAGETLTSKSGLSEPAPLLSTQLSVSPIAALHQWPQCIGRLCHRDGSEKTYAGAELAESQQADDMTFGHKMAFFTESNWNITRVQWHTCCKQKQGSSTSNNFTC